MDCIAYTIYGGHVSLADAMMGMAQQLIYRYAAIIFKPIAKNDWCKNDGFRSVDRQSRQAIEHILLNIYDELGVKLIMDNKPDLSTIHPVHTVHPVHNVHP